MDYSLHPFPGYTSIHELMINTSIKRIGNALFIQYDLLGNIDDVLIPEHRAAPQRKNGLWNETCFEFFISVWDSAPYWEFNVSPSGNWNVYRFDEYRKGMKEESSFNSLPIVFNKMHDSFRLSIKVVLDSIISEDDPIRVAMCSIVKTLSGNRLYHALSHQGNEPDFHDKEGFLIDL